MIKIKNNAFGTLAGAITDVVTTVALTAGHGARFPAAASGGDYFYATLIDASGNVEIVLVTNRATDSLTVVRAQDGTTGLAFAGGDRLELRPTNVTMESLRQESSQFTAATGTNTYAVALSPVPPALNTNQIYRVKFANASTLDAPTLNINSLGAKTIKYSDGAKVWAGEIPSNTFAMLLYDGSDLIWLNPFYPRILAGKVEEWASTTVPSGYLACDGSAVSRTTYAALFAAISTTWGVGDGATTFNLPASARKVTVGSGGSGTAVLGNAVGNSGGTETHTLTTAEMPAHTHTYSGHTAALMTAGPINVGLQTGDVTGSTGGGGAHNNMQPSMVVLRVIKL